ncbi:MAG: EF-P beta-lysylation protein EpmB [Gammaproteobacteria bacterium]|nr:EF-P beta-lysylation protein EpmB [Gammaproteobacteria bacterium]
MIPRIVPSWHASDWQNILANAVNTPEALFQRLELPAYLLPAAHKAHALFPLRVPEPYLQRIHPRDANDPLLRQILPLGDELIEAKDFSADPVGDVAANRQHGLLHKYKGRVLLLLTPACAVHCRYCFRRSFDYRDNNPLGSQWQNTLSYLRQDESIFEVILSGGDPLSLTDGKLAPLLEDLASIPHLRYLRVHTRLPVVIPCRITETLIRLLTGTRLKPVVVLHINHHREIDTKLKEAAAALTSAGIRLLNQSVLLKGVNDDAESLVQLSHALAAADIAPYYLHALDKVQGATHFMVPDKAVQTIYQSMHAQLPGYLLPRLVREIPGEVGKSFIYSIS